MCSSYVVAGMGNLFASCDFTVVILSDMSWFLWKKLFRGVGQLKDRDVGELTSLLRILHRYFRS